MSFGENLSDTALLDILHRNGVRCAAVMAMPEATRTTNGPKGACSPEQGGQLNAFIAVLAGITAHSRGLLTDTELEAIGGQP